MEEKEKLSKKQQDFSDQFLRSIDLEAEMDKEDENIRTSADEDEKVNHNMKGLHLQLHKLDSAGKMQEIRKRPED